MEVKDNIVTLAGTVDSWQEKQLCLKVAQGVKGVKDVRDEIKVEYKMDRQDGQIEAEIKSRLQRDVRVVDDALINVGVKEGRVTLSGTVGSAAEKSRAYEDAWVSGVTSVDGSQLEVNWLMRDEMRRGCKYTPKSDREVEKAVKDSFLYDPRVCWFNPQVEVHDGVVTLTGVVDNLRAKKAAEEDAKSTAGVWWVKNYLKVRLGTQPSDALIVKRVRDALSRDPYVDRHEISSSVINGKAYLYGTVDSYFERLRAEDVVSRVKGVAAVANKLMVNPTSPEGGAKSDWEIKQDIEEELWWDPFVDGDEVAVTVRDGIATLTGIVDNWTEHGAASADAHQAGALEVRNYLRVRNGPTYYRPLKER